MANYSDTMVVESTLTLNNQIIVPATQALANSTLTLTSASNMAQIFTGTTVGQTVKLPNATTLPAGWLINIYNQGTQPLILQDNAGGAVITVSQTSVAYGFLQTSGSAAGTWVFWQSFIGSASGVVNYNVVSSTAFSSASTTDVVITGFTATPTAGTYAIWFNIATENTSGSATNTASIYKAGSQIADSERAARMAAANSPFALASITVAQFNGAQACDVRVRCGSASQTVRARSLLLIRLGT